MIEDHQLDCELPALNEPKNGKALLNAMKMKSENLFSPI